MKKTLLAIAAVATIGMASYQVADARPWGGGPGMGPGSGMGPGYGYQVDEETARAQEKFFNENSELRKQMFAKRTELNAVLSSEKPDEKKAAKLSEELFDLREQMQKKAQAAGITKGGRGFGYCGGPGGGYGMGGNGPHHRGWR